MHRWLIYIASLAAISVSGLTDSGVTYDSRSIKLNGERKLIMSGSIHYARIFPEDWQRVVGLAKEMGLNTIQTYVMWNFHEHKKGNWLWEGRRDIRKFISFIESHNMTMTLRIGPYVCGEYYNGGIPLWMSKEAKCFRCSDPGWESNTKDVVERVVSYVKPHLYPQGGIIMLQIENEYNGGDLNYLNWSVDMARNLTTEVPWNLCHDLKQCSQVNKGTPGGKALCTINGFWMDVWDANQTALNNQPSPNWISHQQLLNNRQPVIWTEDQAWFNQWGLAKRVRATTDISYGIMRFIAYGGTWHNFYMLTGGNNYERAAGGLVTTAYAPDAAITNLLVKHEPRFSCLKKLFTTINSISSEVLSSPIATSNPVGHQVEYHDYGTVRFLSNFGLQPQTVSLPSQLSAGSKSFFVGNHTVAIIIGDVISYQTDVCTDSPTVEDVATSETAVGNWKYFEEEIAFGVNSTGPTTTATEQLSLTDNDSDYLWYIAVDSNASSNVKTTSLQGSILYPFNTSDDKVAILSCAMGVLNNGRRDVANKGLASLSLDGKHYTGSYIQKWTLRGENDKIYTSSGSALVNWTPYVGVAKALRWYQSEIELPSKPNVVSYALILSSMWKGVAYVNGFNIGKYWMEPGKCPSPCAPPVHGSWCYLHWEDCNQPTQTTYHIPMSVIKDSQSSKVLITLFEETSPPEGVNFNPDGVKIIALTTQP